MLPQALRVPHYSAILLIFGLAIANGGCSWLAPYRMEVQQGNFLTQDKVSQLRAGLTRDQVKFLLGTPLVTDVFHADRWDYVFIRQKGNFGGTEQRRLTLFFDEDILRRVEGDVVAADLKPVTVPP
jgi:outer membrane protein assembly factor BamE